MFYFVHESEYFEQSKETDMNGRKNDSSLWQVVFLVLAVLLCFSILPAQAASLPMVDVPDDHVNLVSENGCSVTNMA